MPFPLLASTVTFLTNCALWPYKVSGHGLLEKRNSPWPLLMLMPFGACLSTFGVPFLGG